MDGLFDFGSLFSGFGDDGGGHARLHGPKPGSGRKAAKAGSATKRKAASPASILSKRLDITYIDEDVLCCGRPWENRTEKEARRNNILELANFLDERYGERFLVLNLSGSGIGSGSSAPSHSNNETLDYSRFKYQVLESDLEQRTSLASIFMLCHAAAYWLDSTKGVECLNSEESQDKCEKLVDAGKAKAGTAPARAKKRNVLVVFCGNSVNATRLFVSTFLAFRGRFQTTRSALEFFYAHRLKLDQSAKSILKKQQPSVLHWIDKAQAVLAAPHESMGPGLETARPLHLFMLLVENLPLTTAEGIVEPKFLSFLGFSEEELASAVQPVVRVYELGMNTRRVVYSTSSEAESTVHWDPKEGKLVLKCDIQLVGDVEIECVFAGNTSRNLFRYYLHTGFFEGSGNGVYSVYGDDVDTTYRNAIDSDFKMDLVMQPVLKKNNDSSLRAQSRRADHCFLSRRQNSELGLLTLTKTHFLHADPSLTSRLVVHCSDLEAQFALQRANNNLPAAARLLSIHESNVLPDESDEQGQCGGPTAANSSSPSSSPAGFPTVADAASPASPYAGRSRSSAATQGLPPKRLFSSPLRHHNRRFLKSSAGGSPMSSPVSASPGAPVVLAPTAAPETSSPSIESAVASSNASPQLQSGTSQMPEGTLVPSDDLETNASHEECDADNNKEEDGTNWEKLFADIEAECSTFAHPPSPVSLTASTIDTQKRTEEENSKLGHPKPSTPDINHLLGQADEQCQESPRIVEEGSQTSLTPNSSLVASISPERKSLPDVTTSESEKAEDDSVDNLVEEKIGNAESDREEEDTCKDQKQAPTALEALLVKVASNSTSATANQQAASSLSPFRKMLKIGVPKEAVRTKMLVAGVDPTALGLTSAASASAAGADKCESAQESVGKVFDPSDPKYSRFKTMIKMGIPAGAVAAKMRMEGLDPQALGLGSPKSAGSVSNLRTPSPHREKVRRKKFHWVAIPETQVKKNSIWTVGKGSFKLRKESRRASLGSVGSSCSSPGAGLISPSRLLNSHNDPDMKELEALFSQAVDSKKGKAGPGGRPGHGGDTQSAPKRVALLDGKRNQNVSIGLRKLKLSGAEVCAALNTFDGETLRLEQLQLIQSAQLLPTREEEKKLMSFRGDTSALGEAETYFLELATTVHGSPTTRLEALLYRAEFKEILCDISARLDLVIDACTQVRDCTNLQKLLQVVLLVGNKINAGKHGAEIQGFSVGSLHKLSETKSFDQQTTILDFVAAFSMKRIPEVRNVHSELGILGEAKRVELNAVEAESSTLHIRYQAVLRAIKLAKQAGDEILKGGEAAKLQAGLDQLREFSSVAQTSLAELDRKLSGARQCFAELLDFFCEDPSAMQLHGFFSHLHQFLTSFASATQEFRAKKKRVAGAKKRAGLLSASKLSRANSENLLFNANKQNAASDQANASKSKSFRERGRGAERSSIYMTPRGKVVQSKAASPATVEQNKRIGASMPMTPALSSFLKNA